MIQGASGHISLHFLFKIILFFFFIGNKTFIKKIEYHVYDGEHCEQETNTI